MPESEPSALIESLLSSDTSSRQAALREVVERGEAILGALLQALEQDDRNESVFEFEYPILRAALLRIGDPALHALMDALREGRLGRSARSRLRPALKVCRQVPTAGLQTAGSF